MFKVAVIGTGFIGSVHAKNIARHPGTELVAVSDANMEFAKKIATATGAKAVADIEEIFNNKDIQAVLIATPTNTHVDYLKRAANARKAIYCEKPIGLDYEEAELGGARDSRCERSSHAWFQPSIRSEPRGGKGGRRAGRCRQSGNCSAYESRSQAPANFVCQGFGRPTARSDDSFLRLAAMAYE
jgi:hypothetical protein